MYLFTLMYLFTQGRLHVRSYEQTRRSHEQGSNGRRRSCCWWWWRSVFVFTLGKMGRISNSSTFWNTFSYFDSINVSLFTTYFFIGCTSDPNRYTSNDRKRRIQISREGGFQAQNFRKIVFELWVGAMFRVVLVHKPNGAHVRPWSKNGQKARL